MVVRNDQERAAWPAWAKRLATVALLFHMVAVVAVALASPPSSPLERAVADWFVPYCGLIDQGQAHRYYVDAPPTPIVTARLTFSDGRPEQTVRLPDRSARPRLRYQRQLALAHHLFVDVQHARSEGGDASKSVWAQSYARHLCRTNPGCSNVTLLLQMHLVPDLDQFRAAARPGSTPLDVDAEEFYTAPDRIGDYACDAL
jgi:hypothetical protein